MTSDFEVRKLDPLEVKWEGDENARAACTPDTHWFTVSTAPDAPPVQFCACGRIRVRIDGDDRDR